MEGLATSFVSIAEHLVGTGLPTNLRSHLSRHCQLDGVRLVLVAWRHGRQLVWSEGVVFVCNFMVYGRFVGGDGEQRVDAVFICRCLEDLFLYATYTTLPIP